MPLIPDPRYTQSAIVGPVRSDLFETVKPDEPGPTVLDTLAAVSRQATLPGGGYDLLASAPDPLDSKTPDGFDPLETIAGYEDQAHQFVGADSPAAVQAIKTRIAQTRRDREVLQRAGIGGTAATVVLNLLDPTFLASVAVPEIAIAKYARTSAALTDIARGAAGAAGYESGMHLVQPDRTLGDSAINIGAGGLLGGVLGPLVRLVPQSDKAKLRQAIVDELAQPRSEVGAAAAGRASTLEDVSLAGGGRQLSALMAKTPLVGTDLDIVMSSQSVVAKRALLDLADVPQITGENVRGLSTPASVETAVGRYDRHVADLIDTVRSQWAEYRARVPKADRMSEAEFYAAISSSARRGDSIGVPEVDSSAKFLRERIFDPLKNEAEQLKLFESQKEGGDVGPVVGAKSYFRRMYDREQIRANLGEWHQILASHFQRDASPSPAEVTAAIDDVTAKILHSDVGESNWSTKVTVPAAGPLKGRTLNVPDDLIEKFLVNDPIRVARSYVRDLAPQVELAKRFGDVDMRSRIGSISDEYSIKREQVRTGAGTEAEQSKALAKLTEQEGATKEALIRIRDRVLGRAGRLSPDAGEGTRRAVAAARGWRNLVASARLGGTALTGGLMDTAKIAAQYGFMPTIKKLAQLATSPEFRALSYAQARRVGAAVEVAMSKRVNVAYDGAITEGWTQKLANGVYKYTALNHITDFNRTLSAVLFEDFVLKSAQKVADGKALKPFARAQLASLGLGDAEMQGVARELAAHGGETDGVRVSGSSDWTDKNLADAYDSAILKGSKIDVQQPGAADRVWWMDSELGKFIGQLKTFSLSAPTRLIAGGVQMAGQREYARAARFLGYMMIGGYLTHALRQAASGKLPTTDPSTAGFEALTESGIAGVVPDLLSPVGRRLGMFGESVRHSDRNALSAYGGPALGAANDAYDFAFNRTEGGLSASDLHMLRRMLPWNNVWWLRREITALEGEIAEGLDLKGSDTKTFAQRMIETTPSLPPKQRGGTGTGPYVAR